MIKRSENKYSTLNIEIIKKLLNNELYFTEIYQQILVRLQNDKGSARELVFLIPIFNGHKNAVSSLQNQIHDLGGSPSEKSEVSDALIKLIRSGSKNMLNIKSALKMLLEVEKNCTKGYENALGNNNLPLSIQYLLQWKLLLIQEL